MTTPSSADLDAARLLLTLECSRFCEQRFRPAIGRALFGGSIRATSDASGSDAVHRFLGQIAGWWSGSAVRGSHARQGYVA